MSFPRYERYKDSGVEWLGEVPQHWSVMRLKNSVAKTRNGVWGDEPQSDCNDLACIRVADFDRRRLRVSPEEPTIRNVPEKDRTGRLLARGDLLLEKSGGGENQPVGAVVLYDGDVPAVCTNFVARVQLANGMVPSFWRYVHAAAYAIRLNIGSIKQTSGIQNLDQDSYFNELAAYPPGVEQASIATFLDHETAKIDALMDEQKRLIELLREKRQAVISHAVTKGLDANAPTKDSGVEWLGDVPEHWEILRLGRLFREASDEGAAHLPILSVSIHTGVTDRELAADEMDRNVARSEDRSKYKRVMPGDLVYNMMRAWQGGFGTVTVEGMVSPAYVVARPVSELSTPFIEHILRTPSAIEEMRRRSHGVTDFRLRLYWEEFKNLQIALPPQQEQYRLISFLAVETGKLDRLMSEAETAISVLQERRDAVISAAVTGKIDVRGVMREDAHPKPDEISNAALAEPCLEQVAS